MLTQITVGISGKAGAGKDLLADMIIDKLNDNGVLSMKYSFAYPLKEVVKFVFGLGDEDVHTEEGKKSTPTTTYGLTTRKVLQLVGTESFRDVFDPNIWIDYATRFIANSGVEVVVIPDVRFENEAVFVKDNGSLIHIDCTGREGFKEIDENSHASEVGYSQEPRVVIENKGTLEEFEKKAEEEAEKILNIWKTLKEMATTRFEETQRELIEAKTQLFNL